MNDLDLKQKVRIHQPKDSEGYGIQVVEWEYIKNKVVQIKDEPNIYLILASVFLGAFVSTLIYSWTGYFPKDPDGSISTFHVVSWIFVAFTSILTIMCFIFSKKISEIKQIKASYIVEQMEIIEARYKSEESDKKEAISEIVFQDIFDTDAGWEQYKEGHVSISNEIPPFTGKFCLKKDRRNDPHGGSKKFNKTIGLGFTFSGWIYRPSGTKGGVGDRLSVEDSNFNGYGFCVAHKTNIVQIERRDNGSATLIGNRILSKLPEDEWYQFEFLSSIDGKFVLFLNNSHGSRLLGIAAVDSKYTQFDRITVHGGHQYYIDNLEVIKT